MYRHILIPTDGSEPAEHGVAHGLALAKSLGTKVTVIFVVEPLSEMRRGPPFLEALAKYAELRNEQATSVLDRVANAAKEAGVSCKTIQVENRATPSSHHRGSRGQRLRSHCYVIAWAQRICHASNRQRDKQGADAHENPGVGVSLKARAAYLDDDPNPSEVLPIIRVARHSRPGRDSSQPDHVRYVPIATKSRSAAK